MGEEGNEEFLPKEVQADIKYRFVGNKIDGNFAAYFNYDEVKLSNLSRKKKQEKDKYDLTESFSLTLDSTTSFSDSTYFASIRPVPLKEHEEKIYEEYSVRRDTTERKIKTPKTQNQIFFGELSDILLTNYTVNLDGLGSVKMSPLLNPFLMSYSPSNGFSYRQEFKYTRVLKNDRLIRVTPKVGYNFTRKEFYWSINGDFDYWPRKRASMHINFGNGNRIYSSDVLDDIKNVPDSIFDFDDLDLKYFKDLFFTADHKIELFNGFNVIAGFIVHKRTPIKRIEIPQPGPEIPQEELPEIEQLPSKYISFAPRVRLEWTPGLYYYMRGNRKINLYSRYPTFSVDWERGIKGIFGSTGIYERYEFDIQHQIRLGLMRNIYYRAGVGGFTNQKQMYFVDFANFTRSNLPVGWNDDIGGVFQLLDRRWYNSSVGYARGHFTFESPFLIWPHLSKLTSFVDNERLYFSILFVPHLVPYIELGYGIGTHIFDVGMFVSNINGKFNQIGFKFTFELFNK